MKRVIPGYEEGGLSRSAYDWFAGVDERSDADKEPATSAIATSLNLSRPFRA
jgi:hypothetical protein